MLSCWDAKVVIGEYVDYFFSRYGDHRDLHVLTHSSPTRRSSDLQRDRADALLAGGADGIDQAVEAEPVDARHRGDRLPAVAVVHEDRPDQVVSAQPVLRDQAANPAGAAVAPQPNLREGAEAALPLRSEEHTSELQSLMRTSYAVFCLKKKNNITQ